MSSQTHTPNLFGTDPSEPAVTSCVAFVDIVLGICSMDRHTLETDLRLPSDDEAADERRECSCPGDDGCSGLVPTAECLLVFILFDVESFFSGVT